jgi:hypothetical protein
MRTFHLGDNKVSLVVRKLPAPEGALLIYPTNIAAEIEPTHQQGDVTVEIPPPVKERKKTVTISEPSDSEQHLPVKLKEPDSMMTPTKSAMKHSSFTSFPPEEVSYVQVRSVSSASTRSVRDGLSSGDERPSQIVSFEEVLEPKYQKKY